MRSTTPAFRPTLGDLGLTSNQVWGLTKTDEDWSAALETALRASRRDDLKHGTNAVYTRGCICTECREHQRQYRRCDAERDSRRPS
jgi:hypothetical protein